MHRQPNRKDNWERERSNDSNRRRSQRERGYWCGRYRSFVGVVCGGVDVVQSKLARPPPRYLHSRPLKRSNPRIRGKATGDRLSLPLHTLITSSLKIKLNLLNLATMCTLYIWDVGLARTPAEKSPPTPRTKSQTQAQKTNHVNTHTEL